MCIWDFLQFDTKISKISRIGANLSLIFLSRQNSKLSNLKKLWICWNLLSSYSKVNNFHSPSSRTCIKNCALTSYDENWKSFFTSFPILFVPSGYWLCQIPSTHRCFFGKWKNIEQMFCSAFLYSFSVLLYTFGVKKWKLFDIDPLQKTRNIYYLIHLCDFRIVTTPQLCSCVEYSKWHSLIPVYGTYFLRITTLNLWQFFLEGNQFP